MDDPRPTEAERGFELGSADKVLCLRSEYTTGIHRFAVCPRHTAKAKKHSAKRLPSVTSGKRHSAKKNSTKLSLPSVFCRALGKDVVEC